MQLQQSEIQKFKQVKLVQLFKRDFKHFNEQVFHFDLESVIWVGLDYITFTHVETACSYFYEIFIRVNRHATFMKFRVKCRDNAWFSSELSNSIREHNVAWARARWTGCDGDWLSFSQLRNNCSSLIKKSQIWMLFINYYR